MTLDDALAECPLVAILRGVRPDEALEHVEALFAAGLRVVEVPLNSPQPLDSVGRLARAFEGRMVVGAGTVLTAAEVEAVAAAGGRLIVSPNTDAAVIGKALALGLEPAPGFATATEAFAAYAAGARRLKLFPAASYGVGHLKQLMAVLPADCGVWAVGGVTPESLAEWWAAGARAFGLGGDLYRAGQTVGQTVEKAARSVAAARALPRG
jgi:2-dehydro-3-deoxyphosphogalactonate aldolase